MRGTLTDSVKNEQQKTKPLVFINCSPVPSRSCLVFSLGGSSTSNRQPHNTLSHPTPLLLGPGDAWDCGPPSLPLWHTGSSDSQQDHQGPAQPSPKIPGSLLGCGSSLVFFGCLLFRGRTARGARMGLGLALKKVTMKGCLERGARCPSRPARPGSTLCPERETG